ncbi:MAG TPA: hypothetical protein VGC64_10795, partial [Pyrinomonadaceae bacterium]
PLLIFNQQILTGRSLQPLHYEMYITKYLTLISLVLTVVLYWRSRRGASAKLSGRLLFVVIVISFGWGILETVVATNRGLRAAAGRSEASEVAARFAELSRAHDPQRPDTQSLILYTNITYADSSPALAPQPVLWSPHTPAFSGISWAENKERIYRLLYFTGFREATAGERNFEKLDYQKKYLLRSLVGWGFAEAAWSVNWQPVRPEEIQAEVRAYGDYRAGFDKARAAGLPLSYVVTTTDEGIDFSNLDRWYERDEGERIGKFILYRVRLRS